MNFENVFEHVPDHIKLTFLQELLARNHGLQQQFLDYINESVNDEKASKNESTPEEHIREEAEAFREELEMLDFEEPDWESYVPRHSGYIPEYEALEHMAEDMVDQEFELLKNGILDKFRNGKIDVALYQYIGAYNACVTANINDEYEAIYDHEGYFLERLKEIEKDLIDQLNKSVVSNEKTAIITKAIFNENASNPSDEINLLKFLEPILLTLCTNKTIANTFEHHISEYRISGDKLPQLRMKIHSLKGDTQAWLQEGEKFMMQDIEVAKDVLYHYLNTSNKDFIRIAKKIFYKSSFGKDFLDFLYNQVDKHTEPVFYKDILKVLADKNRKPEYYKSLRELLNPQEKDAFIRQYQESNLDYYTLMLSIEDRHDEILDLLQQNDDLWDFTSIIQRILHVYPDESFQLLKNKCLKTATKERGRHAYQRIIDYLKLASQIPEKHTEIKQLVDNLYNWQPRLPALREELMKAGLKETV